MDISLLVTALWIAVYAAAAGTAVAVFKIQEKKQELQPIPVEENSESR